MAGPVTVASHINIVNIALIKLGRKTLADFDDATDKRAAEVSRNTYNTILRSVMEKIPWDFCTEFHKLTAITLPADVWDFASAFQIPGGALRPYSVQGQRSEPGAEWVKRGNLILTNLAEADGSINTQIIMYEDNVSIYPPTFIEAVAAKCAAEWAGSLVRVTSESQRLEEKSLKEFRDAASSDGGVGSVRRSEVYASCVTVRGTGSRHLI